MPKKTILLFLLVLYSSMKFYGSSPHTKWFEDARFGLFIHFGPYSVLGAGEWVMNTRPIKSREYLRLQNLFNPYAFDAQEWVTIAKNAGMKYITFTSRHYDGFSNWNTKQSEWNIMNTPYGKDLIRQLADECHKQDIKLVFYYSLLDWMRTDYQYETGRTGQHAGRSQPSNWNSYIAFMKAQLTELLTEYGPIAGIWFDGHWDQTEDKNRTNPVTHVDWHYNELYDLIHILQPECLVANNHHLPPFPGEDYQIFERDVPGENNAGHSGQEISNLPLETCQTISESWGFSITDDNFKSTRELIHLLVHTAGTGANLLLNVGPMPNGKIQPECIERLIDVGKWMNDYGYTIYGTHRGPVKPQDWGAVTKKDNVFYIHILNTEIPSFEIELGKIKSIRMITKGVPDEVINWKTDRKSGKTTFTVSDNIEHMDVILEVTK